jgi:hypothetical protein
MGIQIVDATSMPAVTYDRIHMTKLEISQATFEQDTQQAVYEVVICYRHYGVTDGVRYYKNEDINRVSIADFITAGMEAAAQGDMTLLGALQSIEVAVAAIIQDQTGVTTSVS